MIWKILFILHVRNGLKTVCNFVISQQVVYKTENDVGRQRSDPSTKTTNQKIHSRAPHRVFVYFILFFILFLPIIDIV